jgi:glycosyltransferase involved in cell wall biosynthesis
MKIAVTDTTVHGSMIGGGHLFVVPLLLGLRERGHEIHFISADTPNEIIRDRIATTGVKMHKRLWPVDALVEDATPVFARWLNELAPDIHLISASGDLGWTVLPLLDASIATVNIAHSDSTTFYDPLRHYSRFMTRSVGVSHEICEKFQSYSLVDRENIEWIPYGVIPSEQLPAGSSGDITKLVYVGRLAEPNKKVSDLIRIVKRLRDEGFEYSLTVIGDGPMMPEFRRELAYEIGCGKVQMLGWIENADLLRHLRESDVSLLVSESEGFCIALVEAMANGCCPIVTDIDSGNKQLVENGVNGFVVPVGDVGGFVDKIELLAADRGRLTEMRKAAWYTGRQYGIDRMVEDYLSCFERAVEDARSNPRTPDPNFPLMESCRSKYPLWLRRLKAKASAIFA